MENRRNRGNKDTREKEKREHIHMEIENKANIIRNKVFYYIYVRIHPSIHSSTGK